MPNRAQHIALIDLAFARAAAKRKSKNVGQKSIFDDDDEFDRSVPSEIEAIPDWTPLQKMNAEKEVLGFYLTNSPLDYYEEKITENGGPISLAKKSEDGFPVKICGLVSNTRTCTIKSRTGQPNECYSFTLTDKTADIECVAWPSQFQVVSSIAKPDSVVSVSGKLSKKDSRTSVFVNNLFDIA